MQLSYRTVRAASGIKRVVIVAAEHDGVFGPDALGAHHSGRCTSLHHASLAARVRRDPEPIHAVVLRGRTPSAPTRMRATRSLDDEHLDDFGYRLARSQLEAWRPLFRAGVLAVARVELRVWELLALRVGTARLVAELDPVAQGVDRAAAEARADRWILRNALLDFGATMEAVLTELLPPRLDELERVLVPARPDANPPV